MKIKESDEERRKNVEEKKTHILLMLCINTYRTARKRRQASEWRREKRLRKSAIMKTRKAFITNIGIYKEKNAVFIYLFGRLRLLFLFSCISRICNLLNRSTIVPRCVVTLKATNKYFKHFFFHLAHSFRRLRKKFHLLKIDRRSIRDNDRDSKPSIFE